MLDFTFYTPTRYIFGREAQKQAGKWSADLLGNKVLVVFGKSSAKKSGLLDQIEESLRENGVDFLEFGGIQPNPTDGPVRLGIELCRSERVTGILAVGGGSVIDTAKAIAAGVPYSGDFWDFFENKATPASALPIGVVLTIPAAGSEGSGNSVITKEDGLIKISIRTEILRPKFALMNPELTMTLPPYQTACGIVDMMAHILERYFTPTEGVQTSDGVSEGLLKAIVSLAPTVVKLNPEDYDARANIMWAGTLAHNGLCGCGKAEDWASHAMEHEISALYDVAHGAGLSVILLAYMRYMLDHKPERVGQLARNVFGIREEGNRPSGVEGVKALEKFFKSIDMPTTFAELGIENPDIPLMVRKLHINKGETIGAYYPIDAVVSTAIYKKALGPAPEKILVMPDIHGRTFWKEALKLHPNLDTIWLGDYVDPYAPIQEEAIHNFREILEEAKKHDNWTMLLGNHDLHYILNIRGSRKDEFNQQEIKQLILDNLDRFSLAAVRIIDGRKYLFTHAPVLKGWVEDFNLPQDPEKLAEYLNGLLRKYPKEKKELERILDRVSPMRGGDNKWASPIWADVDELRYKEAEIMPGIDFSIFGHTREPIDGQYPTYACLDTLHAHVVLEDGEIVPETAGLPSDPWDRY